MQCNTIQYATMHHNKTQHETTQLNNRRHLNSNSSTRLDSNSTESHTLIFVGASQSQGMQTPSSSGSVLTTFELKKAGILALLRSIEFAIVTSIHEDGPMVCLVGRLTPRDLGLQIVPSEVSSSAHPTVP